jgi:hypothetical protein
MFSLQQNQRVRGRNAFYLEAWSVGVWRGRGGGSPNNIYTCK